MLDVGREVPSEVGVGDVADGPLIDQAVQGRRVPWSVPAGACPVSHDGPHAVSPSVKLRDNVSTEVSGRSSDKSTCHVTSLLDRTVTTNGLGQEHGKHLWTLLSTNG